MHRRRRPTLLAALVTAALSLPALPAAARIPDVPAGRSASARAVQVTHGSADRCPTGDWTGYQRPATNGVVVDQDVTITMRDGIELSADVYRPDTDGRFPVIVQQTPYNKNGPVGGANDVFVQHGYVFVNVDVRGTGGSQGTWDSFGEAEQRDGYEIVQWAAQQPWSNGVVGTWGASYMAIMQILTAAQHPPALKAIFPIVPMADSYRDITMAGGQINAGFIPLWLGLVTGTGVVPPTYTPDDPVRAGTTVAAHGADAGAFQARVVADSASGGDQAYDGPFYRLRSPIEVADRVDVPAFVVGGLHDLFQRGEPLLYERMKDNTTAKLLIGPWTHGDFGSGLPTANLPVTLDDIALQWFDHYLKGMDNGAACLPAVTQWVLGQSRYRVQADWPRPGIEPQRWFARAGNGLTGAPPAAGEGSDPLPQQPANGVCSRSTNQWLIGLLSDTPCATDNRATEATEVTYTSAPLTNGLRLDGPITARVWITTTARDAVLAARVTDVAPDGTSTELSTGLLAASMRKLDPSRSRVVDGALLQPWHPFTRDGVEPVAAGEPMRLDIEIFPTNAWLAPGHRLRLSIGPSDFPHAISPAPMAADTAGGVIQILHDAQHRTEVTIPSVPASRRDG